MATYSTEYLQGIKDGRAAFKMDGIAAADAELAFCERISRAAYSGEHRDYIKGLKDFWTNQKRLAK